MSRVPGKARARPTLAADCVGAGESFAETDKRYLAAEAGANRDDGCTAVTAVLTEHSVVVAHVGDSRGALARRQGCAPSPPRALCTLS